MAEVEEVLVGDVALPGLVSGDRCEFCYGHRVHIAR